MDFAERGLAFFGLADLDFADFGFDACGDELETLAAGMTRFAAGRSDVIYVAAKDVVNDGDPAMFDADGVHPSREGAARIGQHLAAQIQQAE